MPDQTTTRAQIAPEIIGNAIGVLRQAGVADEDIVLQLVASAMEVGASEPEVWAIVFRHAADRLQGVPHGG